MTDDACTPASAAAWDTLPVQRDRPWSKERRRARAERQRHALINDPRTARVSAGALVLWSLCLIPIVMDIPDGRYPVLAAVGVVLFEVVYVPLVRLSVAGKGSDRLRWSLLAVLTAIAIGFGIGYGGHWLILFIPVSMCCAIALPAPLPALAGVLLTGVAVGVIGQGDPSLSSYLSSAPLAGFIIWLLRRMFDAIATLQQVRQQLALTAVADERLRFARDLHDLLGHTLSLIVVKSEVVRRLAHTDPDAAAREAADIEAVGRTALTEIRQAVSGYREQGLAAELEQAQRALSAASITATVRTSGAPYPPEVDALLGWVVREGVTNVIRHSRARRCQIEVHRDGPEFVATIDDDGIGGDAASGNGLAGLAERAAAVGGRMEAHSLRWRGFRLQAAAPVGDQRSDSGAEP